MVWGFFLAQSGSGEWAFFFSLLNWIGSVDFGRNLCEKYCSLPLIENGNDFLFGRLFYEECIINEK